MAHIVTLKDNNDEISYPITPVDAVFVDSNTTLDDALDEKADVDLSNVSSGAVTASKIDFSTLNFGNYSTSEVDTGFTWIDGSKIYKKTIEHLSGLSSGVNTIAHNISNIGIVIKKEIIGYASGAGTSFQLPMAAYTSTTPSGNSVNQWGVTTSAVQIYSTFQWSDQIYITLYYTKTS
jgi:hypothetical protein